MLAGDLKKGTIFEYNHALFTVLDFQHVKPGKGAAFVRVKIKNIINKAVIEKTLSPNEKLSEIQLESKQLAYSYQGGDLFYFMDNEYNLISLTALQVQDVIKWIKENDLITVKYYQDNPILVTCEIFVVLQVVEADPAVKGDTATNAMKNATLENGTQLRVPLFIKPGDYVKIDTRTGEYLERVNINKTNK